MTMSIISGLSCTQSSGDTTATVANIFQHEQNATRLEVDVFHNPAAARFIFGRVINTAARISHNLWEKNKAV